MHFDFDFDFYVFPNPPACISDLLVMAGNAARMDVAEVHEARAAKAAAVRKRQSKKDKKERQRRQAEKERDVRIAEQRKHKQQSTFRGTRESGRRRAAHAQTPPADAKADKRWKEQLARGPELLKKIREGKARIDALVAKFRQTSISYVI